MPRRARALHESRPLPPGIDEHLDESNDAQELPQPGRFRTLQGSAKNLSGKGRTAPSFTVAEALREALKAEDGLAQTSVPIEQVAQSLESLPLSAQVTFVAGLAQIARNQKELAEASLARARKGEDPVLPTKAPLLWSKRDRALKLSPVAFTRMTYGPWLGKGFTRGHLRELDKGLYHALANWISRHPDDAMPELPSQSEQLDQKVARLAEEFTPDELRRLGLALQARLKRSGN
jgi:hypothetical protein